MKKIITNDSDQTIQLATLLDNVNENGLGILSVANKIIAIRKIGKATNLVSRSLSNTWVIRDAYGEVHSERITLKMLIEDNSKEYSFIYLDNIPD